MDGEIDDDDMVVVIIGDDDYEDAPYRDLEVTVKQEPLDESDIAPVEEILKTVTKHGEFIEIKQEIEEYEEIEQLEEEDDPVDPTYRASEEEDEEEFRVKEEDDEEYIIPKKSTYKRKEGRRPRIFGPRPDWRRHKPVSYVQKLRDENPEFKKDPAKLINHLAEMMRKLRPPKLPADVVDIKLSEDGVVTYGCSKCEVELDTVGAGHRHYQRYHGDFYLMCYACSMQFTNSTNLYKHEKSCRERDAAVVLKARGVYLGVKGRGRPFCTDNRFRPGGDPVEKTKGRNYCSQCPASFAHKENLVAHELTHAGLRPYRCNQCPAAYTSDVGLKRHLATHGDYKFECDDCGKRFKLKPLLVSHMDVHRPLAKFPCPECPRRFTRRITMQRHVESRHLRLPHRHACLVCNKRYGRMAHVRDHMKVAHGLAMITRSMFFQNLPKMKNISLREATVVLKQENGGCIMMPAVTNNSETETNQQNEGHEEENAEDAVEENAAEEDTAEEDTAEEEDIKPIIKTEANEEVSVQYIIKNEKIKASKKSYQIQDDNETPEEDSIANFLRALQNVKPGTKIVPKQKTKPKTQYLKPPEVPAPYQPKVKIYYQPELS